MGRSRDDGDGAFPAAQGLEDRHAMIDIQLLRRDLAGVVEKLERREKPQPPNVKFRIPADDAPNLLGAADLGFPVRRTATGDPDLSAFTKGILGGAHTLYVFDPGPEGSIGDVSWIIEARRSGA